MKVLLLLLVAIVIGVIWFAKDEEIPTPIEKEAKSDEHRTTPTTTSLPSRLHFIEAEKGQHSSTLADDLNQPDSTIEKDLTLLKAIFSHYRTVFKQNPTGVHQEIVAHLIGGNAQDLVYIPKNHPALVNGQLHDRWGSPFYFHQISGDVMEVRSAGPDKIHWNEDDIFTR